VTPGALKQRAKSGLRFRYFSTKAATDRCRWNGTNGGLNACTKDFPAPRRIARIDEGGGHLAAGQAQDTSTPTPSTALNPPPLSTTGLIWGSVVWTFHGEIGIHTGRGQPISID